MRANQDSTLQETFRNTSPSGENEINVEDSENNMIENNNNDNANDTDNAINTTHQNYNINKAEVSNTEAATNESSENILSNGIEITFDDEALEDNNDSSESYNFEDADALVDQQIADTLEANEEDYEFRRIQGHHWKDGVLVFTVELTSGQIFDVPFSLLKKDRPIFVPMSFNRED